MRHKPVRIDGIAMKSSADLVVHSSLGHLAQRGQDHLDRFLVLGFGVIANQEVMDAEPRELGSLSKTASLRVEDAAESEESPFEGFATGNAVARAVSEIPVFSKLFYRLGTRSI